MLKCSPSCTTPSDALLLTLLRPALTDPLLLGRLVERVTPFMSGPRHLFLMGKDPFRPWVVATQSLKDQHRTRQLWPWSGMIAVFLFLLSIMMFLFFVCPISKAVGFHMFPTQDQCFHLVTLSLTTMRSTKSQRTSLRHPCRSCMQTRRRTFGKGGGWPVGARRGLSPHLMSK